MHHQFKKVDSEKLENKEKEVYNYHKATAKLADYGFDCIRIVNDWDGVDFLAYHSIDAVTLRVQLKGRPTIERKYLNKGLWIIFPMENRKENDWYLIQHDLLVRILGIHIPSCLKNKAWNRDGKCDWGNPTKVIKKVLEKYRL